MSTRFIIIALTILFCGLTPKNKSDIIEVRTDTFKKLRKRISNDSWNISQKSDEISLVFIDTFFVNTSISPIRNENGFFNKRDTISIQIRFEDNWSRIKFDSIKIKNKEKLEPLKNKFIAYYDSLNWIGIKLNQEMFLEKPFTYLKRWKELSEQEKKVISEIVILPDKLINNIGIFVKTDYRPPYMMIESKNNANNRFYTVYDSFADVLGRPSLFKYEENY